MKITKSQLKQIIKEELQNVLEQLDDDIVDTAVNVADFVRPIGAPIELGYRTTQLADKAKSAEERAAKQEKESCTDFVNRQAKKRKWNLNKLTANQALAYEKLYDYCQRRKKSKKSLYKRPDTLSVKRGVDAIAGGRTRRFLSKLPLTAFKESQLKQIIKEEIDRAKTKFAMIGLLYFVDENKKETETASLIKEAAYWLDNFLGKEKPPNHLQKNIKKAYDIITEKILSEPEQFNALAKLGNKWKVERLEGTRTERTSGAAINKSTKENFVAYEWESRLSASARDSYLDKVQKDTEKPYVIIYNGNPAVEITNIPGDLQHKKSVASDLLFKWLRSKNIEGRPSIGLSPTNRTIMQMIIPKREGDFTYKDLD